MSSTVWDDPEIKTGGEFVKFETPGDTVSGTITAVRSHRFDDGKVAPQILIIDDRGEERTITAGQNQLKAKLVELRPGAGDHIKITFTESERRPGGKTLKHFDVEVRRGGTPEPAPSLGAAPVDAQSAAAALANLTPEQRKALGLA